MFSNEFYKLQVFFVFNKNFHCTIFSLNISFFYKDFHFLFQLYCLLVIKFLFRYNICFHLYCIYYNWEYTFHNFIFGSSSGCLVLYLKFGSVYLCRPIIYLDCFLLLTVVLSNLIVNLNFSLFVFFFFLQTQDLVRSILNKKKKTRILIKTIFIF